MNRAKYFMFFLIFGLVFALPTMAEEVSGLTFTSGSDENIDVTSITFQPSDFGASSIQGDVTLFGETEEPITWSFGGGATIGSGETQTITINAGSGETTVGTAVISQVISPADQVILDKIAKKEANIEKIEANIEKLNEKADKFKNKKGKNAIAKLAKIEVKIVKLEQKIEKIEERIAALKSKLSTPTPIISTGTIITEGTIILNN